MMKNLLLKSICFALFIGLFISNANSQTAGTLNINATTTFTGGSWGTKSDFVLWIENSSGVFVKTRVEYGDDIDHLKQWKIKSPTQNTTDATTGATITTNPKVYSAIKWIGNDLTGTPPNYTLLPDGIYYVAMEIAFGSSMTIPTGRDTCYIPFYKGPVAQTVTPANKAHFTNITLQWTPAATGIQSIETKEGISVYPNPCNGIVNIEFDQAIKGNIQVTNLVGDVMYEENANYTDPGHKTIDMSELSNGIYLINIPGNNSIQSFKVVLTK